MSWPGDSGSSRRCRVALGDMHARLWPLVEGEQLPWDRYKARLLDAPKDAPPDASGEGGGKLVDGTLTVTGDVTPPAPFGRRGGEKVGRTRPSRGGDQVPQGRVRPPCSVLGARRAPDVSGQDVPAPGKIPRGAPAPEFRAPLGPMVIRSIVRPSQASLGVCILCRRAYLSL